MSHKGDAQLLEIFLAPIRKCLEFRPAFGTRSEDGVSLREFQDLYGQDPFYSWLGLDDAAVYAAHKASGAITSVYRQIGVGSERLLRQVISTEFSLDGDQLDWSYEYERPRGKPGVHHLDARISLSDLRPSDQDRLRDWLGGVPAYLTGLESQTSEFRGVVMEIRQGYKSADAKRQNADLRFGMRAYQASLLPVILIMSTQVSEAVINRYRSDGMLVLVGTSLGNAYESTYSFVDSVIDFDLKDFFARNASALLEVRKIMREILKP